MKPLHINDHTKNPYKKGAEKEISDRVMDLLKLSITDGEIAGELLNCSYSCVRRNHRDDYVEAITQAVAHSLEDLAKEAELPWRIHQMKDPWYLIGNVGKARVLFSLEHRTRKVNSGHRKRTEFTVICKGRAVDRK